MRIGHYDPSIWANGGIASYVRRISQEQVRLGHEVVYFDRLSSHIAGRENEHTFSVKDDADLFLSCAEQKLDILHLHSTISSNVCPVPAIRTLHTHQPYCPSGGRFLKRQAQPCDRRYSLLGCTLGHLIDHCGSVRPTKMLKEFRSTWNEMETLCSIPTITVSHFLKEQMVRSGYAEELIHVLHLPAPKVKAYSPPPATGIPRFIFLGRLAPQKGVSWLLRALKETTAPIHLDIAGEGQEEPELRHLAAQLGIEDRVTFHGWIDAERVNSLLREARALVFPSVWHEPGGTVAFEAMVNGRAVIMSRVGGMPEVISEEVNGLLTEPNNVAALAYALERLATDWELAQRLGNEGRKIVAAQHTLESYIERLMKLYSLQIQQ